MAPTVIVMCSKRTDIDELRPVPPRVLDALRLLPGEVLVEASD